MNYLEIPIRSITGRKSTFKVHPRHTIANIKKVLAASIKTEPSYLFFVYNKKELTDEQTIESIGLEPGGFLVYYTAHPKNEKKDQNTTKTIPPQNFYQFQKKNETKPPPKKEEPKIEKPKFADIEVVPPSESEMNKSIDFLQNMGFARAQCENALKFSDYNVEVAADLLCTGQIPDVIENKKFNRRFTQIKAMLQSRKITPDIIAYVISRFNNEDKKAIRNLMELGIKEDKALLAYIAFDKNEAAATNMIITMLE